MNLRDKKGLLRALHHEGRPLILPNAWDAASARVLVAAGFPAIATASHAVADSLGYEDGEGAPPEEMFAAAGRVTRSVDVPVSVDAEAGYGLSGAELADGLATAGAAGCNIEDTVHARPARPADGSADPRAAGEQPGAGRSEEPAPAQKPGRPQEPAPSQGTGRSRESAGRPGDDEPAVRRLADVRRQAELIAALRDADPDLVINARADAFVPGTLPGASDEERLDEAVTRARTYLDAGADAIYPILASDETLIRALVERIPGPVNVLYRPGAPSLARLAELGVRRVTFGPGLHAATLTTLGGLADRLRAGEDPY